MTITYHEEGTDIDQPFEWRKGLLIRPSDFSITRWSTDEAPEDPFWWNMLDTPHSDDYNPTKYLQARLSSWDEDRPAFITALIHENNFNFGGGTPWALIYYADKEKATPLQPPFDLDAPDNSHPRSLENREAIWNAYEEMVQYAAAHLQVVTSEDIVIMADQEP